MVERMAAEESQRVKPELQMSRLRGEVWAEAWLTKGMSRANKNKSKTMTHISHLWVFEEGKNLICPRMNLCCKSYRDGGGINNVQHFKRTEHINEHI